MAPTPRPELRPSASLTVTPRLRQAIALLALSHRDLAAFVDRELEGNPLLVRGEGGSVAAGAPPRAADAAAVAATTTLRDHLVGQLHIAVADPGDRALGRGLIGLIDEAGYLGEALDTAAALLGCDRARAQAVLQVIQGLDPAGVGARGLAECLALQLRERGRLDPAMAAMLDHLDLVARHDLGGLSRACGVDEDDVRDMLVELRALDPKPGLAFGGGTAPPIVPDVLVRPRRDGGWHVELNGDALPRVLVDHDYRARIAARGLDAPTRSFVAARLEGARWLVRSLARRARTLLAVATEIVARQESFLRRGPAFLEPLTMKEVARAIAVHESTVSRAAANKHLATPRGTYAMKSFFTNALAASAGGEARSAAAVRHRIRQLVDGETPHSILSDEGIAAALRGEGVAIARRTVAKYREAMRIPPSALRRRQKEARPGPRRGPGASESYQEKSVG